MEAKKEYRGIPFWSWNGILEKQEIIRQVYVLKEMGFGGFFMHSRTGLATESRGRMVWPHPNRGGGRESAGHGRVAVRRGSLAVGNGGRRSDQNARLSDEIHLDVRR